MAVCSTYLSVLLTDDLADEQRDLVLQQDAVEGVVPRHVAHRDQAGATHQTDDFAGRRQAFHEAIRPRLAVAQAFAVQEGVDADGLERVVELLREVGVGGHTVVDEDVVGLDAVARAVAVPDDHADLLHGHVDLRRVQGHALDLQQLRHEVTWADGHALGHVELLDGVVHPLQSLQVQRVAHGRRTDPHRPQAGLPLQHSRRRGAA